MPIAPPPTDEAAAAPAVDPIEVAAALAAVGREVRDAVRAIRGSGDASVVRTEGGDDVFGVDARADEAVLAGFERHLATRWPGELVMEGFDDPIAVGGGGEWRFIVDPVDGTRPYLAGKRSAWVLLGGGRGARTLEDLEVGAAVEVPTDRARVGMVAWAAGGELHAVDEDLVGGGAATPVVLRPRSHDDLEHAFVTVVHFGPGVRGPIGAWADVALEGLRVFDDLTPCTGGALMDLARGADAAVVDPRPLFSPTGMAAHPYDLAALVVARAAGVVVEAVPAGPLDIPLDPHAGVAFAAYANEAVASRIRRRLPPVV